MTRGVFPSFRFSSFFLFFFVIPSFLSSLSFFFLLWRKPSPCVDYIMKEGWKKKAQSEVRGTKKNCTLFGAKTVRHDVTTVWRKMQNRFVDEISRFPSPKTSVYWLAFWPLIKIWWYGCLKVKGTAQIVSLMGSFLSRKCIKGCKSVLHLHK